MNKVNNKISEKRIVRGYLEHEVYLENSVKFDSSRVYTEKEAANDIFRMVVNMLEAIRFVGDINFRYKPEVMIYQEKLHCILQKHMLELPEHVYRELDLFFHTEIRCIFVGDSGLETLYESHIKEEYVEERYGSKDIELNFAEIMFSFIPYLEKRILSRMREIFKEYIPT